MAAVSTSTPMAIAMTGSIHAGDLIKLRLDVAHAEDRHRDTDRESGNGLQHRPRASPFRSPGSAPLPAPCGSRSPVCGGRRCIGSDTIEADGGEQKRQQTKREVRRAISRSSMKRSSICCWKVWNFTIVRLGLMLASVSPTVFSNPAMG